MINQNGELCFLAEFIRCLQNVYTKFPEDMYLCLSFYKTKALRIVNQINASSIIRNFVLKIALIAKHIINIAFSTRLHTHK